MSGTEWRIGDGAEDKTDASLALTELTVCWGDRKEERSP